LSGPLDVDRRTRGGELEQRRGAAPLLFLRGRIRRARREYVREREEVRARGHGVVTCRLERLGLQMDAHLWGEERGRRGEHLHAAEGSKWTRTRSSCSFHVRSSETRQRNARRPPVGVSSASAPADDASEGISTVVPLDASSAAPLARALSASVVTRGWSLRVGPLPSRGTGSRTRPSTCGGDALARLVASPFEPSSPSSRRAPSTAPNTSTSRVCEGRSEKWVSGGLGL